MTDQSGNDGSGGGEEDKVGYRKPPKKNQYKPGQSGNLRGRPRSMHDAKDEARKALLEQVTVEIGGRKLRVTRLNALLLKQFESAEQGNPKAVQNLLKLGMALKLFEDPIDDFGDLLGFR